MSRIEDLRTAVVSGVLCIACFWFAPAMGGDTTKTRTTEIVSSSVSPEAVVDGQLAAYNRRDLEGFLRFYAEDAVLADHPNEVTQTGKAEIRARYLKRFSNPVHAEIIKRVTFGSFVIDHERVVAAPPAKGTIEAVAIYEIKEGKIVHVTFLRN